MSRWAALLAPALAFAQEAPQTAPFITTPPEVVARMLENPAMKIMHDDFDRYVRGLLKRPTAP